MATSQFSSHQVDILYESNSICAGSLISAYLVLTLYSCLVGKNETELKVRASGNSQIRNVDTIHSYPALKRDPSKNDIAVILLDSDFSLDESLEAIDIIPRNSTEPEELIALSSSTSTATSCGNIRVQRTEYSELDSNSDCWTDKSNSICVKFDASERSSCPPPPIGSGLICQIHGVYFLCGALAGNKGNATTYTDISKYLHWIRLTFEAGKSEAEVPEDLQIGATLFGGREVSSPGSSSSIPYQLSLQRERGGSWKHVCGAVIIDTKNVLTAAHCFEENFKPSDFRVVAGISQLDPSSNSRTKQIFPLQKIIRHNRYRQLLRGNDIAILHVNGSFVYNENLENIWISPPNGTNPTDFTGRVSGWGKTYNDGAPSNSLQQADMEILEDSECNQTWTFLKPSMICTYDTVSNTCNGDSGGPLTVKSFQFNQNTTRDLLIGITSFSSLDCGNPDKPNGFTEVSYFYTWIKENRAANCEETEFQCLNGHCLDECSVCDKIDDCGDGSDEEEKQCPGEIDLEKTASCAQKRHARCEKTKEELKTVIESQSQKIQELEDMVKTLTKTIVRISEKTGEKVCLDGVESSEVSFYEDKDFAGSEKTIKVGCSCQEIPEEWRKRVLSLRSTSCVTFFGGRKCSQRRQQLSGSHSDLTLYNLDNQVASFELCSATAERPKEMTSTATIQKEWSGGKFGGDEMSVPYQLSLQHNETHACVAVLIDERTALTAANCFDRKDVNWRKYVKWRLVAGMRKLDETDPTQQILPVQRIIRHEKYRNVFRGDDIALVVVNGSFVFNENVQPIWISSPIDPVLSGVHGTSTGWGNTTTLGELSNDLKIIKMPLVSHEVCKANYFFIKGSIICSQNNTANTCAGDAGGPLVLRNYQFSKPNSNVQIFQNFTRDLLVGIASFGPTLCEDLTRVNGFTKISSYYDWIESNWNRNTKTTAQNNFVCFNGEEIDGDWKCDAEWDCDDGSDEKGCNIKQISDQHRHKSHKCGGEIQLWNAHDIIYRVPDSESNKTSVCLWTIYNFKNNPTELTLLANSDAKLEFDPAQNQLIALSNFTLHNFEQKLITRLGQRTKIADSYTTLIFRGSSGGFYLRLKSVVQNETTNPLNFKREDLTPNLALQNYSYPSSGFYRENQRIFTVLSPSQTGRKIRLNVNFGELEGNRDWIDIIGIGNSISQQPKSLFRFTGARSWTNNVIEGAQDETLVVFMSTGNPAVKRKGIKFAYSEQQAE